MRDKRIPSPGFADDDGSADAAVAGALAAFHAGSVGKTDLVASLTGSRLIVPVTGVLLREEPASAPVTTDAQAADAGSPTEPRRDKEADVALILIKASDGRTALPAFTSLAALHRWKPDARPVPAAAQRVCSGALAEGADLVVVDPSGPVTVELAGSALWALAQGRPLLRPAEDPEVVDVVRRAGAAGAHVFDDIRVHPGQTPDTDLVISLVPRPSSEVGEVREAAGEIASLLAADPVMRSRVDHGVQIAVVPAPPSGGATVRG